jgi:predicted ATP-binding protein involved in virulence
MQLKKVEIIQYRNFKNIVIDFEKSDNFPNVFAIASKNGGGKSTLLQFIFTFLHCFMDEERKQYLKNILEYFPEITEKTDLVKFVIEDNNQEYSLDFSISPTITETMDFNLYLDIEETRKQILDYQKNEQKYQRILQLKKDIEVNDRITPSMENNLNYIKNRDIHVQSLFGDIELDSLYNQAKETKNLQTYKNITEFIINKYSISEDTFTELKELNIKVNNQFKNLEYLLNQNNIVYITHLKNNKNVLLLQTNMPKERLVTLTNQVYLNAPASQVFLFLSNEEKHTIFNDSIYHDSYYENLEEAKKTLNGFFTYDFVSTSLILKTFQKASNEDLKIKRETGHYGNRYDELTNELKNFLDGKEIRENSEGNGVIFTLKNSDYHLSPEDLSHGELKKLGIYIWLKYIVEKNSIILMDELDIALHPQWQYELVKDLTKWSQGSQFLLATHSPQILSSTYYKNIIKLDKGKVERYSKPPIDRDINSIITQVMDAPDFPMDLLLLHKEYRKLINDGKVDSDEAKQLKSQILEYESESSSFFQDINFDLELM